MASRQPNIPILTDVMPGYDTLPEEPTVLPALGDPAPGDASFDEARNGRPDTETLIAELQTRLAAGTFALTENLLRAAFAEMEAKIYQQISARLRQELPELIDSLLREHLDGSRDL